MEDEDAYEDEFLLVMMECYDLSILFREPRYLEEFVYQVIELGDEGNEWIDAMRGLIQYFRRNRWTINNNMHDATD